MRINSIQRCIGMTVTIKKCTVEELLAEPNFTELLNNYADELAVEGLPHPKAKLETYVQLEKIGLLHPIAAFWNGTLVGFINVLMGNNQHYGVDIAVSESFFVAKDSRKTGAGTKLREAAERLAKSLKSPGFYISTPHDGPLVEILPRVGYKETSRHFFKGFANV